MDKEFWKGRVEKYGHTGWSNQSIYAFDQPIRIDIVKSLVRELGGAELKTLLDFGCGTGDFTGALRTDFREIVMYDTCKDVIEKSDVDVKVWGG